MSDGATLITVVNYSVSAFLLSSSLMGARQQSYYPLYHLGFILLGPLMALAFCPPVRESVS